MKYILSTLIFMMLFGSFAFAQEECRIFYDYDAAGNRIKRYYHCYNPNELPPDQPGPRLYPVIFPNPTDGPVAVAWYELVDYAIISIIDMQGRALGSATCNSCYQVNYDLTDYVSGTYIVQFSATRVEDGLDHAENFTVIKIE